jgi:hypothetical protein
VLSETHRTWNRPEAADLANLYALVAPKPHWQFTVSRWMVLPLGPSILPWEAHRKHVEAKHGPDQFRPGASNAGVCAIR